jgi:glyoxylase-like metal-dependent hydrolase (beta-lactamase superfamily II)
MIRVGAFELHLINDVTTHVDGGGAFGLVPKKLWSRYFTADDDNNIPMSQTCLYVRAHGKHIIIDTGLGTRLEDKHRRMWNIKGEGGLLRGLDALGVAPAQIDLVINTHLHSDHCGGNVRYSEDGTLVPTFPNAQYVVQRREYEDAMRPNERTAATYIPENYAPLVASGQMRLLDGDTELMAGVTGMVTEGHTPAHMSVALMSEGQTALFLCDVSTYAVHFERIGWMTAYDVEPLKTLETKRRLRAWAMERDALLIFPHDPFRRAGYWRAHDNGGAGLEVVDEAWVL